jgi:hypothetical protein
MEIVVRAITSIEVGGHDLLLFREVVNLTPPMMITVLPPILRGEESLPQWLLVL